MSLQTDFAVALFSECKKMMINTAIETQGTTSLANYQQLAPVTDTFCSISSKSTANSIRRCWVSAMKVFAAIWNGWLITAPR